MPTTHPSRLFASGDATTLYATIPAALVADSQFPFAADQAVTISIDGDSLTITAAPDDGDG